MSFDFNEKGVDITEQEEKLVIGKKMIEEDVMLKEKEQLIRRNALFKLAHTYPTRHQID